MRPTDEEVVARHLSGDPHAFPELVSRYAARLFNLAYRSTGERSEAEDIVQECFLRVYAALPRSRANRSPEGDPRPFKPWLFQIAVNLCRDRARKKRPASFSDLEARAAEGGDSVDVDQIADQSPLPLEALEAREVGEALRRAVMALPEDDRLLLTLRYNEELPYEDIGELLGLPAATVGTRLFRAKRRLRGALTDLEEAGT